MNACAHSNIFTRIFTATVIVVGKTWKQPKCPLTGEWINYGIAIEGIPPHNKKNNNNN